MESWITRHPLDPLDQAGLCCPLDLYMRAIGVTFSQPPGRSEASYGHMVGPRVKRSSVVGGYSVDTSGPRAGSGEMRRTCGQHRPIDLYFGSSFSFAYR